MGPAAWAQTGWSLSGNRSYIAAGAMDAISAPMASDAVTARTGRVHIAAGTMDAISAPMASDAVTAGLGAFTSRPAP